MSEIIPKYKIIRSKVFHYFKSNDNVPPLSITHEFPTRTHNLTPFHRIPSFKHIKLRKINRKSPKYDFNT